MEYPPSAAFTPYRICAEALSSANSNVNRDPRKGGNCLNRHHSPAGLPGRILLLLMIFLFALPLAARTESAVPVEEAVLPEASAAEGTGASAGENHTHAWEGGSILGSACTFSCSACGEKRSVYFRPDDASLGYVRISESDGAGGGRPGELSFRLTVEEEPMELSCQWYTCEDAEGTGMEPVSGAVSPILTVPAFSAPAIRFYACVAQADLLLDGQPASFSVTSEVFRVAFTGLPALYVTTDDRSAEYISLEDYTPAALRLTAGFQNPDSVLTSPVRIKGRGNSTWGAEKRGYTLRFERKTDLMGLGKAKKWALIPNHADRTLLRNWFASLLASDVFPGAGWVPRYRFVDLFLDESYVGNYCLATPVTLTRSRVDLQSIDELKEDVNGDGRLDLADGGFILEADKRDTEPVRFVTDSGLHFAFHDPDLEDAVSSEIPDLVRKQVQELENALLSNDHSGPRGGLEKYLDMDSWVNWYLVNEYMENQDADFFASVFLCRDPADALFHMGPVWDFDLSSGSTKETNKIRRLHVGETAWFGALRADPVFSEKLHAVWTASRERLDAAIREKLPAMAGQIRVSAELNFLNWPILGTYDENFHTPKGYEERLTFDSEVDFLSRWLQRRAAYLDGVF